MIPGLSKALFALFTMVIFAGGIYLAFKFGRGEVPMLSTPPTAIADRQPTATPRFTFDDRGRDTGRQYQQSTPTPGPLNVQTAEAASLSIYKTAVAGAALPDPTALPHAPELPDCSGGQLPCQFDYSSGPAAPNLATGGTNTGSSAHPQKDTDQAADPWGGDKP